MTTVLVLTDEELAWIAEGLDVMIGALGDDVEDRDYLVKARAALERHSCWLCPAEARDLLANAHNAVVNYGSARERKKMVDLVRAVNRYDRDCDAHFRATNDVHAEQPRCARLEGCEIRPGGTFHNPECPADSANRQL